MSPHRESRPRSGSDSSSSSPTSTMDVPQSSSSSILLMTSLTQSPGLKKKSGKEVDRLTLPHCATPVLNITRDKPAAASRTSSSLQRCLEFQRNERRTNFREIRKESSRSFRKSHSLEVRPLTPPKEDEPSTSNRRSIFDTFWKSEKSVDCQPPPLTPMDTDDLSSTAAAAAEDHRLHESQPWLPAVPTPLVRMHSHCGVYPLVKPQSILRKSLLRKTKSLECERPGQCHHRTDGRGSRGVAHSFNLTQSMRIPSFSKQEDSSQQHAVTDHTSQQQQHKHPSTVHFDPRVVVTELADAEPRAWYNEQELQSFQTETVLLARSYLNNHPHLIPLYSQPVRNIVTGAMRKRALFTLEVFRQEQDNNDIATAETTTTTVSVQQIRIVDPHPATLALLRRSFAALFPEATIDCSCGDDQGSDTEHYSSSWDILVLDGSVLQHKTVNAGPLDQQRTSNTLVIGLRHRSCNTECEQANVVDISWDKPIPSLNAELRQSLLRSLGDKRRRNAPC